MGWVERPRRLRMTAKIGVRHRERRILLYGIRVACGGRLLPVHSAGRQHAHYVAGLSTGSLYTCLRSLQPLRRRIRQLHACIVHTASLPSISFLTIRLLFHIRGVTQLGGYANRSDACLALAAFRISRNIFSLKSLYCEFSAVGFGSAKGQISPFPVTV